MNKRTYILTAVLVLVAALLVGCSGQSQETAPQLTETTESTESTGEDNQIQAGTDTGITPEDSIHLTVTSGYGSEMIHDSTVSFEEGWTVYDLMLSEVTIDTEYGGSFISEINGLSSAMSGPDGLRMDWFYYINGVCADVGVIDYELQPGDTVWWDYHSWTGGGSSNPAVTGGYPEVFVHGYGSRSGQVQILFAEGFEDKANTVATYLEGLGSEAIGSQALEGSESLLEDRRGPTMVIGEWQQLSSAAFLADLNTNYEKTSQFIHFGNDGSMALMTYLNQPLLTIESTGGAVYACGQGLGDANPLWIVTGTDSEGVDKAAALLTEKPEAFRNTYSIAVEGEEITYLPIVITFDEN